MPRILTQIRQLVVNYIGFLFNEFDPIKNEQTPEMGPNSGLSQKWPYLLGLYSILAVVLQVAIGLDSISSLDDLEVSFKTALTHRLWPHKLGTQIDFLCSIAVVIMAIMLLCLLHYPPFDSKHFMFKIKDSQTKTESLRYLSHSFNATISTQILAFRSKTRLILKRSIQFFCFFAELYFLQQILRSGYWNWNIPTFLFWFVHWQLFLIYAFLFIYFLGVYVVICCECIKIQQKFIIGKLGKLLKSTQKANLGNFLFYHRSIAQICNQLKAMNAFWSRYLTLIFLMGICLMNYGFYVLFFMSNVDFLQRSIFLAVFIFPCIQLSLLIRQCAQLEQSNVLIDGLTLKFVNCHQKGNPNRSTLLKVQTILTNNLAPVYGFKLSNGYLIKSNALFMTFYYMSVYFMLNYSNISHH